MKKTLGTMVAIMVVAILTGTFIAAKYAAAGEKARDGRFIAYDNGTVLDTKTNLMWAAKDNGNTINWTDAKSYCENYRGGGYTDWRMPTQDELAGLYDEAKTYTADNGEIFHLTKLIHLTSFAVWASEIGVFTSAPSRNTLAATFIFSNGKRLRIGALRVSETCALPVRSVK
jgi:hypothetical protein